MAWADDFANCMTQNGLSITADAVPDGEALKGAIDYMKGQFDSLDGNLKEGLNAVTGDGFAKMFSSSTDDGFNFIDGAYDAVLDAFDNATDMPIGTAIEWCKHCIDVANQAGQTEGATNA